MMETVGMARLFQHSLSHRSVRYTSYIENGDSKTFSSITASNPYGEDITVSKIECVGHVQKRMGSRLRKLKQMGSKLSDGKSIGGNRRPQANRTERVNRDLVQMIANYVNEQHDTWDQFLIEFAYAIRTAVNETTGKAPAELFLGRKLITPFQKLVMASDGTEFAVGNIERLFEEARQKLNRKNWTK
ncbi:uncharacterized protein TNCV_4066241 [Trichonephila clavipes]|uniref:Mutator-like transposase domain-containing protein n=1 Tax=Trichonephila clavipes TaxID=2585209 RepID=A0A8X6W9J2_TRICX|nr:uncharacterized protein TNCV_4066241 [Trichonephila clavipes]